ncbi:hypothetical protein DH2020_026366 [Rehmannia glutinosa]|uniref:Uncharacterized protein n=1 Tax=Rehmannia glutinosa TaxID=99300 RepID=A0ABR0W0Q6_REHGL
MSIKNSLIAKQLKEQKAALLSSKKRPPPALKPSDAHAASGSGIVPRTSSVPHLAGPTEVPDDTDTFRAARTTPARLTPQRPTSSGGQNVEKASASRGKSHKEKAPKPHKSRSRDSGSKDREEPSSKKLRLGSSLEASGKQPETEADEETCSNPEMEAQVKWLEMCERQLAEMREIERQRTHPQISSTFNASLPRTIPNWLINGRSSVLDTHAGEDSFELYKHTLLGPDQFALIPFEFTRLEEYIAHNNFLQNKVERLSKALLEAEAAKDKFSHDNTALVNRVQGLEQEVNAARNELKEQKENHESELKETYDTGRK